MGIRSCAMACEAFRVLREVYDHREAAIKKLKDSGKKIVGQLGYDVPDELILASGMVPVRIFSREGSPDRPLDMTLADQYLEYAFDPMMRAKFQQLVDGTWYGLCDALAISNSTDVIIRLYLYLRELCRIEPEIQVPPMDFIDWLFTRHRVHQVYNEGTVVRFMETIRQWSGTDFSKAAIEQAGWLCNEHRSALRKMALLRNGAQVRISGSEALVIIGSGFFMDIREHTRLIEKVCESAALWPEIKAPRLYYTGSVQETTAVYDQIESCCGVIVGEDHDWGERFFDRDYNLNLDPVRGIVDCYMLRAFSSKKAFVSQRVETLKAAVEKCRAQAVIFYNNIYEEAASWDYPEQKKCMEAMGIATCCFSKMAWPVWKNEDFDRQLSIAAKICRDTKGGGHNE